MFRTSGDRRIAIADTALSFHHQSPISATYDSLRLRARMIPVLWEHGGSASPEDDGRRIAEGANIRRQSRMIANALRTTRSTYRFARIIRRPTQMTPTIAIAQGARKAIATPIMRKLHMIAPALCASVRRRVASKPLSSVTILPWL